MRGRHPTHDEFISTDGISNKYILQFHDDEDDANHQVIQNKALVSLSLLLSTTL
jgi:hypothetical protein